MAYITLGNLSKFLTNLRNTFVSKEHKTGSTTDYKVLSDNNLTDALVKKINEAGSSSFNGDYASLTSKPSIDGHEIAAGDQTAASLGLETAGAAAAARTGAVDDVKALGYQTAAQVGTAVANGTKGMVTDTALAAKGYQTADQVNTIVAGKGYQTAAQVEATVTGKGYQTSGQVDAKVNAARPNCRTHWALRSEPRAPANSPNCPRSPRSSRATCTTSPMRSPPPPTSWTVPARRCRQARTSSPCPSPAVRPRKCSGTPSPA